MGLVFLLSEFYRSDATRAVERGWPVIEHSGRHLDIANEEEAIADTLVGLAGRDRPSHRSCPSLT